MSEKVTKIGLLVSNIPYKLGDQLMLIADREDFALNLSHIYGVAADLVSDTVNTKKTVSVVGVISDKNESYLPIFIAESIELNCGT